MAPDLQRIIQQFTEKKRLAIAISTYDRYGMFGQVSQLPSFGSMKVPDIRQSHLDSIRAVAHKWES